MAKFYYHGWLPDEEKRLNDIMTSGIKERKKMRFLFEEAACELGRTAYSCQNRWYDLQARKSASKAV